ncbi:thioesterase domain-containing protein [Nodularia spumigena CS-586/05]|uniref:thioesterase domain-containing protein n=1 Tax=Nodularia spumigena TaxID=70799 RepID=UPI00232BE4E0|nr:thioesterase domain-containing protein [Nodularia spumigena]MDB9371280.1 thioesterase domain-containing protein [Nodularia spumigena CS-586/05]
MSTSENSFTQKSNLSPAKKLLLEKWKSSKFAATSEAQPSTQETIEQLASVLRQQFVSPNFSPLVPIQPRGSKRPFFCVHPIGGNVLNYIPLASYLSPEQPFYGLQARGIDGQQTPLTQVEEIADSYIEAMRTIQSEGPYLLGGWSMGGIVALEMAIQLHRKEQQIAQLIVIDSALPNYIDKRYQSQFDDVLMLKYFALFLGGSVGKNLIVSDDTIKQKTGDEQIRYIWEQAKLSGIIPPDVELMQIRTLIEVFKANVQAVLKYVPQGTVNRLALFLANDMLDELLDIHNPKLGWDELTVEPVEIYSMPGNHYTMLAKPQVQVLAEQLSRCIDEAQLS